MNKEDLEIIAGDISKELYKMLYGEVDYKDDKLLVKVEYCSRISGFVINRFMEKINEAAINE